MTRILDGKRALVTGAATGLGRAFALALAAAGADVAAGDRDPAVAALADELQPHGVRTHVRKLDVTEPNAVRSFVDASAEALGGLEIVVNNAGVVRATSPTEDSWEQALEDFEWMVGVNLRGSYLVGRAAVPHLVRGGGDIVNITTDHIHTCGYPEEVDHGDAPGCKWAGFRRPPLGGAGFDVYDASKWGLKGLTQVWARALAPYRVRVNSLGMGSTNTPMYRSHLGGSPLPAGVMEPEQVAAVLVELIAEGPEGRTGDSVVLWPGHSCALPPVSVDGLLARAGIDRS